MFPIVQSYKFKSKSQQSALLYQVYSGVPDSSKLQIQKQITTNIETYSYQGRVFPIVQSYKFKSKSQQVLLQAIAAAGVPDSSKLQIQKQITTY